MNVIKHGDAKVMAQRCQSWNPLFYNERLQNEAETCVCVVFRSFGWAAQSGSKAVDAESDVRPGVEEFVRLRHMCL